MLEEWEGKQLIPVKKNTERISQKVWEFSGSFCFVNPCLAERSQNPSWKHSVSPCTRSLFGCLLGPWSLLLLPCNPVLHYSGAGSRFLQRENPKLWALGLWMTVEKYPSVGGTFHWFLCHRKQWNLDREPIFTNGIFVPSFWLLLPPVRVHQSARYYFVLECDPFATDFLRCQWPIRDSMEANCLMLFTGDRGVPWHGSIQSFLDSLGLGSQRPGEGSPQQPLPRRLFVVHFAWSSVPQRSSSQLSFFPSNTKSSPSAFLLSSSLIGLESRWPRLHKGLCA